MRAIINKLVIISIIVIFCSNAISADHNTCADEIRNRYRKACAAAIATSPITVPLSIPTLGMALRIPIGYAYGLKKYWSLLTAATMEYYNVGNQKSAEIIDKFYRNCFSIEKREREEIGKYEVKVTKYSKGNNQSFSLKPMELTIDYVVNVLHLLNTEPALRKECLRFKLYYSGVPGFLFRHLKTENDLRQYKSKLDGWVDEYHFPENNLVKQFDLETVGLD